MKFLFALVFICFSAFNLFSQTESTSACDGLIKTEFDSLKGTLTKSLKEDIVVKKEKSVLTFSIVDLQKTFVLSIHEVGGGDCIDETNKVNITFRDGTKLEIVNNGGFNCDGLFSIFFLGDFGNKKQLGMLLNTEIQFIKVGTRKSAIDKTRKNFVEMELPSEKSKQIMEALNCLLQ